MLRGLFEGAQYNSEAGAKCAVYSRARTKQGRGVIKEIRHISVVVSARLGRFPQNGSHITLVLAVVFIFVLK